MRAFHDRAGAAGELVTAVAAQEHSGLRLAAHAHDVGRATMRAVEAISPARGFDMLAGCVLVIEDFGGQVHGLK